MLRWKLKDLEPLIANAVESEKHFPTYGQNYEGITNPPASLHWVKDSGIYLMSNGSPSMPKPDGKQGCVVIYADGFDPDKDDAGDVWDRARAEVGGDDFSENIEIDFLLKILKLGKKYFTIKCKDEAFTMSGTGKRTDTPKLPNKPKAVSKPKAKPVAVSEPVSDIEGILDLMEQ